MENCPMHSGHEERMDGMDGAIQDVRKNIRLLATGQQEIRERLARDERDIESALRMIRDQEAHTKAITKMGLAIEHMAEQVKDLVVIIKEVDGRVDALERAPGDELLEISKRAKMQMVDRVVAAMVGAAIALVVLIPQLVAMAQKAKEVSP